MGRVILGQSPGMEDKRTYRKITVEEHFSTVEHLDYLRAILDRSYPVSKVTFILTLI
jgi:hypothetical protein